MSFPPRVGLKSFPAGEGGRVHTFAPARGILSLFLPWRAAGAKKGAAHERF